jgi:hypothetical protein
MYVCVRVYLCTCCESHVHRALRLSGARARFRARPRAGGCACAGTAPGQGLCSGTGSTGGTCRSYVRAQATEDGLLNKVAWTNVYGASAVVVWPSR